MTSLTASDDYALITGASSGIGAAIAREYARRSKPLILTARRVERLHALARELAPLPCHVIAADLADPAAPAAIHGQTQELGLRVDTLVNNAGYGVPGAYLSSPWQTHVDFLQVLLHAPCELTYLFLPAMKQHRFGRVLNIASLAGLVPASAGHTLYGASKAMVIHFSEALALEMREYNVHVTALCPGFTYSEFHDVNGMRSRVSKLPRWLWLTADAVAQQGIDAVERGQMRCVPGPARFIAGACKYLPDIFARALVAGRSGDFRNAD